MKIFFRLVTFLVLTGVFGVVLWCALAPTPDLVNIEWMPRWIGKWADANPTFRNFPAFGILAMGFYAAGFAWFDPRRGAGQCALAFIGAVTASFAAVAMEVAQVRLPGGLVHVALALQPPLPVAHSSTSTHAPPLVVKPEEHEKPHAAAVHVALELAGVAQASQRAPHELATSLGTQACPHACWP